MILGIPPQRGDPTRSQLSARSRWLPATRGFHPACCPALRCQSCPGPALYQSLGRGKRFGDASGRASHRWRARLQLALVLSAASKCPCNWAIRSSAPSVHSSWPRIRGQSCRCLQGRCSFPSTSNETPRGSPPDSRGPSPRPCRKGRHEPPGRRGDRRAAQQTARRH